jgi:hypothetical protein
MSGFKRTLVTISEEEYRRLYDAEDSLHHIRKVLPETLQKIQLENKSVLQDQYNDFLQRQQEYNQCINFFDQRLADMEVSNSRALLEQQESLLNTLEKSQFEAQDALFSTLETNQQALEQRIQDNFTELDQINQVISNQAIDQESILQSAGSILSSALQLKEYILETYPPNLIDQPELDRIDDTCVSAQNNLQLSAGQAALVQAQNTYTRLSHVRVALEQQIDLLNATRRLALQKVNEVMALLEENQLITAIGPDGNELPDLVRVQDWDQGKWQQYHEYLSSIIAELKADQGGYSMEYYTKLIETMVPDFEKRIEKLVTQVRLAVINSQIRVNIADTIIQAMLLQGYELKTHAFLNNNFFNGYEAVLKGANQANLTLRVMPVTNILGQNDVQIESHDAALRSEHELKQRAKEILSSISRYGLDVGEIKIEAAPASSILPDHQPTPKKGTLRLPVKN